MAAKMKENFILVFLIIVLLSLGGVRSDEVARLIYEDIKGVIPCVLLTNATHQIGCTSTIGGHVGVLHFVQSQDDVDWLLNKGKHAPYIPILTSEMFKGDVLSSLAKKNVINGALVIFTGRDGDPPKEGFSPDYSCPNDNHGLYRGNADYSGCKKQIWNTVGNAMSFLYYGIPIFLLHDSKEVQRAIQCYEKYNSPVNRTPEYPLCSAQLKDFMFAAKDTPTCMRKTNIPNPTQNMFCDPLGDLNIWSTLYPMNKTPNEKEIVVVAAKMDSSSFFHDLVYGADNDASGVIALLAAAKALGDAKRNGTLPEPKNPIMFVLFHGESWDYIGSSRMVYEMEQGIFPPNPWKVPGDTGKVDKNFTIGLKNIKYFIELNQVALGGDQLWAHTDPVSRKTGEVDKEVQTLMTALQKTGKASNLTIKDPSPGKAKPLPPASFQRFLMSNNKIPGVVLTDHEANFTNKYYNSRFDDLFNVQGNFSRIKNTSQIYLQSPFTEKVTKVANTIANTLYTLANDGQPPKEPLSVDPFLVGHLAYCSFYRGNCPLHQEVSTKAAMSNLPASPMSRYVSVNTANNTLTVLTNRIMLYFTGYYLPPGSTCSTEGPNVMKKMRGSGDQNGDICVNGSVYFSKAESPAFVLKDYTSTQYSTWAESTWNADLSVRIFLVASPMKQITTLVSGIVVTLLAFGTVFFVHRKADQLFTPIELPADQ
ncbi:nicastrin [Nematostella vectensis]|uniref:nicastrin n=1 Tax=Nematostella vectensis TaxID=45351 RepID=UPI002077541D|nr:nicastrin [Nematostella vectensis]